MSYWCPMNKKEFVAFLNECVRKSLNEAIGYDGQEEPKEIKKARLAGRKQAREKFAGKPLEDLQAGYLAIERKANSEVDDLKNSFLWGALDALKAMIKMQGGVLPRPDSNPWLR